MDGLALQVCAQGNLSLLCRLLDGHDVLSARDASGASLLHVAARAGHAAICAELLARDPALNMIVDAAGARASDLATVAAVRALLVGDAAVVAATDSVAACGGCAASSDAEAPTEDVASGLCSLPAELAELVLWQVAGARPLCFNTRRALGKGS